MTLQPILADAVLAKLREHRAAMVEREIALKARWDEVKRSGTRSQQMIALGRYYELQRQLQEWDRTMGAL